MKQYAMKKCTFVYELSLRFIHSSALSVLMLIEDPDNGTNFAYRHTHIVFRKLQLLSFYSLSMSRIQSR